MTPITLPKAPPLTKAEEARIRQLIHGLMKIDRPDFGFSSTMSGTAFSPIPGTEHAGAFLFANHGLKQSTDVGDLVKLGPKALPYLLEALTYTTPTKLVLKHVFESTGGMWFANELTGNPANSNEFKVLKPLATGGGFPDDVAAYTVKVGDVCFVIIGQIVGRSYQAARYQPTAITVLCCPAHDTNMAAQIRGIWSSLEPDQHLLNSLMTDFATESISAGRESGPWEDVNELQCGAALRLVYYFPKETGHLIADRLNHFDVRAVGTNMDAFSARESANGVRTEDFIKSVAWSEEPAVRLAVQKIFLRTDDVEILIAAAPAFDRANPDPYRKRLEEFLSKLSKTEEGPFGNGYSLLVALGKNFGSAAKPAFEKYLENPSLQRRRSMCRVLAEVQGEWSVVLLAPYLDDKRPAEGWTYPIVPGKNEPRLPIRICDEVAGTIAQNFKKLTFKLAGEHKDLDRQIEQMKARIARKNY